MIMYTKIMEDLRETAVMLALASVVFGLLMLSMRYLYGMDFSIIVPMIGYFMLALLLITFIPAISLCLL